MSDRDLIARALVGAHHDPPFIWNGGMGADHPMSRIADAVIAALAGRIIPPLPDTTSAVYIELFADEPDSYSGPGYRQRTHAGTGPDLAAAIANALENL